MRYVLDNGFTMIEMLIVLLITGLLAFIAVPYYGSLVSGKQLEQAARLITSKLELGQSLSERNDTDIYVTFKTTGTSWCFGFSDTGPCDCNVTNSCQVSDTTSAGSTPREMVWDSSDYAGDVNMKLSGFSHSNNETLVVAEKMGLYTQTGDITLSLSSDTVVISIDTGQPTTCSNALDAYPDC